ncbi:MAG TPA: efflux RND transporter permease subunit [Acetobacteraceae bacterium]|nr:efflux RND transporter permease subunit [Acetobacteraceae bacterium]
MNLSALFINRPVATTLLTIGIVLAGLFAYAHLPVAPLPQVDFPTIVVQANLPGASPDTVAATVASPLERHLGTIADVTEMTSTSTLGQCRIILQFGLDRDINGAARDVQAAINAARADLPTNLRSNPTWRKFNPASAPIMVLALTSATLTRGQIYDAADTVVQQRLSQVSGIGEITLGGSALPAVRVELNPNALSKYGIGLEDVRAALAAANANSPKGAIEFSGNRYQLYSNDQASSPSAYAPLVIAWRNNAPVRLSDVATITEGVENVRTEGLANGQPAVLVILYPQPGANIIDTVDQVNALLPVLRASIPSSINVSVALDQSTTIRASLADTQVTLLIAVFLVISVVFLFLRDPRAALIPSVALPVSIIGTFAGMYLLGYSLDNLSLMALTISTGFVVDDAIVVLENISRHLDAGLAPREAALRGASEVGFTVLSMSTSLVAVFLPILLMGGIVGRLFREFGMTLSLAIAFSLLVSLTTTPMMCAIVLRPRSATETGGMLGRLFRASRATFDFAHDRYAGSLGIALRHPLLSILALFATLAFTIFLFIHIPKGLFPTEDTGVLIGGVQADQSISFQSMEKKLGQFMAIVRHNPAVQNVTGFTGGGSTNSAFVFVTLKPLSERHASATQVIAELRRPLGQVAGAQLFLQPAAILRAGGRQSNAAYQFSLQGSSASEVYDWTRKLEAALAHSPVLRDVNSDQQQGGLETNIDIDRSTAARLGVTPNQIDNTLYDAFGQRQVSTIYREMNQYHVVMEVAPQYWQSPTILKDIYVSTSGAPAAGTSTSGFAAGTVASSSSSLSAASIASDAARNAATNAIAASGNSSASSGTAVSTSQETMVPLSAFARFAPGTTPLSVNHQGLFVASTISFNLAQGKSLSDAGTAIRQTMLKIGVPVSIHGSFAGTAQLFVQSLSEEPILILAALLAVYTVLGILYESTIHPITILSTLPSAGVGALLALMLFHMEFTVISLIGLILLIGIVKKNAIMMIDFAINAERSRNLTPRRAIREAAVMRFRPIMMTTVAAILGAAPLVLSQGYGYELRQPLGVSIIGGLLVSQVLTLYTTPVIYLYLDRFSLWLRRISGHSAAMEPGE